MKVGDLVLISCFNKSENCLCYPNNVVISEVSSVTGATKHHARCLNSDDHICPYRSKVFPTVSMTSDISEIAEE